MVVVIERFHCAVNTAISRTIILLSLVCFFLNIFVVAGKFSRELNFAISDTKLEPQNLLPINLSSDCIQCTLSSLSSKFKIQKKKLQVYAHPLILTIKNYPLYGIEYSHVP